MADLKLPIVDPEPGKRYLETYDRSGKLLSRVEAPEDEAKSSQLADRETVSSFLAKPDSECALADVVAATKAAGRLVVGG